MFTYLSPEGMGTQMINCSWCPNLPTDPSSGTCQPASTAGPDCWDDDTVVTQCGRQPGTDRPWIRYLPLITNIDLSSVQLRDYCHHYGQYSNSNGEFWFQNFSWRYTYKSFRCHSDWIHHPFWGLATVLDIPLASIDEIELLVNVSNATATRVHTFHPTGFWSPLLQVRFTLTQFNGVDPIIKADQLKALVDSQDP